eukprot:GFUD01024962.1.p1 GENE.GFUD01024962.1~~GFUD01024962.1.p1  ORF type:complete len:530 (+),score=98.57 GFUD01024962.1:222-1592(+)
MVCDGFSRSYYGDRIPWARLESFSIAEGLDKIELRRTAHELHDRFLARVEMQSMEPIEPFKFRQVFRPPENVNNLWVSEVALASVYYVFGADQLNIFLNGGIIKEEGGEVWHYRDKKELEVVRGLSKLYEEAQGYINDTLKQRDHMKKAVLMFLEFEADKAAGCFYDQLAQSKATLHRTFVETVPKEKFVGFTKKMAQELKKLIGSEKTEKIVTKLLSSIKSKMLTIDTDKLTSHAYFVFLRSRSLVLAVKVEKAFEDLNEVDLLISKGLWETYTGKWPAMVNFITNFYRYTFASKQFWLRIDALYHEQLDHAKRFYEERQKSLESQMNDDILPFFRSLLEFMVDIREGKRSFIDDFIDDLEKVDLNEIFAKHLTYLVDTLSRHFLSCYSALHGKPDFNLLIQTAQDNSVGKAFKELVFKDWPKGDILPKGFDEFVQKLETAILLIMTSVFGSCAD